MSSQTARSRARYRKGSTVVHPRHGTVKIKDVTRKDMGSGPADYLVLEAVTGALTLMVRADQTDGLRPVASGEEAMEALDIIASSPGERGTNWVARARDSDAKIAAGTLSELAEVVRDLSAVHSQGRIGTSELRALTHARAAVVGEIAAALRIDQKEAAARVEEAAASRDLAVG